MPGRSGTPGAEADEPALLGTARLLTGSDSRAAELVVRVLARRPATPADAVADLVRVHLGRWARLTRGSGSIDGGASAPETWWASPTDVADAGRLDDALDRLSPPQRTVLVLTHHDGLTPEEVSALVPGAAALLGAAHLALVDEVPDPADLPARMDGLVALTPGGTDLSPRVLGLRTARRRRWAAAAVAVACLVAASVLVPADVDLRADPPVATGIPTPPEPAEETWVLDAGNGSVVLAPDGTVVTTAAPLAVTDLDALFGPSTRGSLAGDAALLEALRAKAGEYESSPHFATESRVLFAGDVDGRRIGVVVAPQLFGVSV